MLKYFYSVLMASLFITHC